MKKRHNLFIGFKSRQAIPFHKTLVRDFLVEATLDRGVHRIDYQASLLLGGRNVRVDGIIVERIDGRFAVDLVDARPECDPKAEALMHAAFERDCAGIIAISADEIRAEPLCSAAREVWSHRAVRVRAHDREQILEALESEGPFALARLDELIGSRNEARRLISALACEGAVELDLGGGLVADAMVRLGNYRPDVRQRAFGT